MRYLFILLVVLVVYALVDCLRHDDAEMPVAFPKALWVVLIIVFPGAGAIAWLLVSRVARHSQRATRPRAGRSTFGPGRPSPRRTVMRQVAPDDDPEFLASLERQQQQEPEEEQPEQPDDEAGGPAGGGSSNPRDEDGGPTPRR